MVAELLQKLRQIGYEISLEGDRASLHFVGENMPERDEVMPLVERLQKYKAEVIEFLQRAESEALNERMAIIGENCSPDDTRPRVENDVLIIPFTSDSKYHWWKGGMSPCDTLKELGRCDLLDKYRHISKN